MHRTNLGLVLACAVVLAGCYSGRMTYAGGGGLSVDTDGRVGVEGAASAGVLTVESPAEGTGFLIETDVGATFRPAQHAPIGGRYAVGAGAVALPDDWGYRIVLGAGMAFDGDGAAVAPMLRLGLLRGLDVAPGKRSMLEVELAAQAPLRDQGERTFGQLGVFLGYRALRTWSTPDPHEAARAR